MTTNIASAVIFGVAGMSCGVVFVLACGDTLTVQTNADAAIDVAKPPDAAPTCDCPVTERPLAGRFTVVSNTRTLPANGFTAQSALCPVDSQPMFGSCTTEQLNPIRNVTLRQAGFFVPSPTEWMCFFGNNENVPVTIRSTAICLKPVS
jgi:hypothetical protein